MDQQQYAQRVTQLRAKLYSAAMLYFGQKSTAQDVLDEAVYKGLCAVGRLRDPACFEAWMMRIVINECHRESRRRKRLVHLQDAGESSQAFYDGLPLRMYAGANGAGAEHSASDGGVASEAGAGAAAA